MDAVNPYTQRRIKTSPCCFSCKYRGAYETEYEEFTLCYCMLGVSKDDWEHVNRIEGEGEDWDERFCNIMMVNDNDCIEDSPRVVEPDDVCQFYEREKKF